MTRKFSALAAIGLTIGGSLAAPALARAQSGIPRTGLNRVPDPNAKRIMVTVFKGNVASATEKDLGVKAADELRSRIGSDFPFKQVYVLPKTEINSYLEASGFSITEALAPHDARALAVIVRADEYVTGGIVKTPAGFKMEANLVLARDNTLVQPLGTYEAPKMGDVSKLVSLEMKEARKQLEFEQKCVNSARDKKLDAALAFAKEGIAAYPKATLARICQARVMAEMKAPADQMLAVAREIVTIDPKSKPGLEILAQSFKEMKMEDSAVVALTTLLSTDPNNPRLQEKVVFELASVANPKVARPVIDEAVRLNPGEPDLLRLRWLILLAVRDYKEAYAQGDELVKLDTSFADTTYFIRTSRALQSDSQYQKASEMAALGLKKFAGQPSLTYLQVATLVQAGQNEQALAALSKAEEMKIPVENGGFIKLQILTALNRTDEILPMAKSMIAAGDTTVALRQQIIKIGSDKQKLAQRDSSLQAFGEAEKILMYADSVAKGDLKAQSGFLLGYTYVLMGQLELNTAAKMKDCELAKKSKAHFGDAQVYLPRGGKVYVDQLRQLMGAVMQLDP